MRQMITAPKRERQIQGMLFPLMVSLCSQVPVVAADEAISFQSELPKATHLEEARYPHHMRWAYGEGWAILNYCVGVDGKPHSAIVESSSGSDSFEKAALTALDKSTFLPGTKDGKPVNTCNLSNKYLFMLDPPSEGARPNFVRQYRKIQKVIQAGELKKAETMVQELLDGGFENLYEDSYYWLLRAQIARSKDDKPDELTALVRVLENGTERLDKPTADSVYRQLFLIQLGNSDLGAALITYDRAMNDKPSRKLRKWFEPIVAEARSFIDGANALAMSGTIRQRYWRTDLIKPSFYLSDVKGTVESVELRCGQHIQTFPYGEMVWTVPESWGACCLILKGQPETAFKLVQQNVTSP